MRQYSYDAPTTLAELEKLSHILHKTTSAAKREAVLKALLGIACKHHSFEIEGVTYSLITVTEKPFLLKMGTPHSCAQEDANTAGYHRLNALVASWQRTVQAIEDNQGLPPDNLFS